MSAVPVNLIIIRITINQEQHISIDIRGSSVLILTGNSSS